MEVFEPRMSYTGCNCFVFFWSTQEEIASENICNTLLKLIVIDDNKEKRKSWKKHKR